MKKFISVITDNDIRIRFDEAAAELEEEKQIHFPNNEARADFIEDCVNSEIDKYELYDYSPFSRQTNYAVEVLDMAKLYGYKL